MELDWKVLGQLVIYAFGAGGVVQQLRNLNGNVSKLEKRVDAALQALTQDISDLRERTSSLEAFREFVQRGVK
jgi:hypothetical protein